MRHARGNETDKRILKKEAAKHLISNLTGGSHASQLIQITQICTTALNKRILMRAVNPLMLGAFPLCKMPVMGECE